MPSIAETQDSHKEQSFDVENGIAISHPIRMYHPQVNRAFESRFKDRLIRVDIGTHGNGMPIPLLGSARNAMILSWFNGDNYREAIADLALVGEGLTVNPDAAGPNTERLGVFFPFADLREHDRTRKPIKDSVDRAIVRAQGITDDVLAKAIKHVAGASYAVFVDMHNPYKSSKWFEGLDLINLTTNKVLTQYLLSENLLTDNLESVVASVDIGNLASAYDLAKKLGTTLGHDKPLSLAVFRKTRVVSEVIQQQIWGDVRGKRVIITEDMISGGTTTVETIGNLLDAGSAEIIYYATHPVFVEDYYSKLSKLLTEPKVKLIMTSNSLPLPYRKDRVTAIPYAKLDGTKKEVAVLDISDWLAEKADTILTAPCISDAKAQLQDEIIEPRNPYDLLYEISRQRLEPTKDVAIYEEGEISPLPRKEILFLDTSE